MKQQGSKTGSIWRKWDLHIHTPASFVHWKGKSFNESPAADHDEVCRATLQALNDADAVAFAIMDYWTFDGFIRLRQYLENHPEFSFTKTVFPGMEMRCEAPTDSRMNIHVLLSNELTTQQLQDFKASLKLIRIDRSLSSDALAEVANTLAADKLKAIGNKESDRADPRKCLEIGHKTALISRQSLLDAFSTIPEDAGLLFLPFDTYNGIRIVEWREHPLLTTEFMHRAHIFEARQADAIDAFHGIRTQTNTAFLDNFQQTIGGKPKPAVSGSDAHAHNEYAVFPNDQHGNPRCTWVKADPTFRGLRQLLTEPATRIHVGAEPPKRQIVQERPTRFIRSILVRRKQNSSLEETWFDVALEFNHDLVAIIGNKGAGKSALADILGLLGHSKRYNHFSFLNTSRFRDPKANKAQHFEATLTWESGDVQTRCLNDVPDAEEVERVRYLPQNYLETVCNEIKLQQGGGFDAELKGVIFSHVPQTERLGRETLDDLLEYKTEQTFETIAILKTQLHEINVAIAKLERQSTKEHRQTLEKQLELKKDELRAHEANKPKEVVSPSADPNAQATATAITTQIEQRRVSLGLVEKELLAAAAETTSLSLLMAKLSAVEGHLDNFNRVFTDLTAKLDPDLKALGITLTKVVSVTIDRVPLTEKRTALNTSVQAANAIGDPVLADSAAARKAAISAELIELQNKLDGPSREYQDYLSALAAWQAGQDALRGTTDTPGTLSFLDAAIAALAELPAQRQTLETQRRDKAKEILLEIGTLADAYRTAYKPVQEFSKVHPLITERFGLNFTVTIRPSVDFADRFFQVVSHGVAGSFCGTEEGHATLRTLMERHDFSTVEGALAFADDMIDHLKNDKRGNKSAPISLSRQLRKGQTLESIYDLIFAFDYLKPQYNLNLGQKELSQLSPGDRGMLLLMFYLLIDKDDIPLIVDQPEGNLDNKTVFRLLGECLKEAKKRRQIIIVTHNPNLAVACDAEQIICASINQTAGNKVHYKTGAIENPEINALLLDILEGTKPAFDNRDAKYFAGQIEAS